MGCLAARSHTGRDMPLSMNMTLQEVSPSDVASPPTADHDPERRGGQRGRCPGLDECPVAPAVRAGALT
jgi:hypothetical protein